MTTKLTLSINEKIVEKAKRISKIRGKSVSKLVEEYISSLPEKGNSDETAIDKIKKITSGKITNPTLGWKQAKEERLTNKYGL